MNLAALLCACEAAYVQVTTTGRAVSPALLDDSSFLLLFGIDIAVPLCVALLSRGCFMVLIVLQAVLSSLLLHYSLFFYNPLTLSTIYHSLQGLGALGGGVFAFARWHIVLLLGLLCLLKLGLVQLSRLEERLMPPFWNMRGITAVICMAAVFWISTVIYAKTGLSLVWIDSHGHRTATERRLEDGTREAVRSLGYVATWIGELLSGTYADLELIYAEARCRDPGETESPDRLFPAWDGNPVPPLPPTVVLLQVESLDFEVVGMKAGGVPVMPFLSGLEHSSLCLKAFAPHKVGSANSDYELFNSRVADQNVIYYEYIQEYPDSVIRILSNGGYETMAFHGLEGSLFHLREAYAAMGFTHTYFKEELRKEGRAELSGMLDHLADKHVFSAAVQRLKPGEKQVFFIVTMDSHIPFSEPRPEFAGQGGSFARYISALRNFDDDFKVFYGQLPAGTLLLIWGDHGSDIEYPKEYRPNRRHVPFFVHIKNDTRWMPKDRETLLRRRAPEVSYTLCELSYYLKRVFSQSRQGAALKKQPEDQP